MFLRRCIFSLILLPVAFVTMLLGFALILCWAASWLVSGRDNEAILLWPPLGWMADLPFRVLP